MSQDAARAVDPRTADVYDVLDELSDIMEAARAMPMSDRCVVNRNEVLDLLDALRQMLPRAVQEAEELLADRVAVVEEGYREAERMIAEATGEADAVIERGNREAQALLDHATRRAEALVAEAMAQQVHLVSTHEVTQSAFAEAEAIRQEARAEADAMRRQVDQYVDAKFAAFEASLAKTLASVQHGRDRIRDRFGVGDADDREA